MTQHVQTRRFNQLAQARSKRVDRTLTPAEVNRIRRMWGNADFRMSQAEIARAMNCTVYAVKQAISGKASNLYYLPSTVDPIRFAKAHSPTNVRIRALMGDPR